MISKLDININSMRVAFVLLLLVCFAFSMQSQVTIGTQAPPRKGAILDLKESEETSGDANSMSGMMMARVFLTKIDSLVPMLTGLESDYESIKPSYSGLTVYNVNPNAPFEKGLYVWDGTLWKKIITTLPIDKKARNGLSTPDGQIFELNGDLNQNTTLNLKDYNLIFNQSSGKIGAGVTDPEAILDINNQGNSDPFILKGVKLISDDNTFDNANPSYYNVRVSESGAVRKAVAVVPHQNESFVYTVRSNLQIAVGDSLGNNGSNLTWTKDNVNYDYVTLPEDGTFAFSFRLYGLTSGTNDRSSSYFLCALKNGVLHYSTEIVISLMGTGDDMRTHSGYDAATCTVNLTVTGTAGDRIQFKMGRKTGGVLTWQLRTGAVNAANRTSMFFWRL